MLEREKAKKFGVREAVGFAIFGELVICYLKVYNMGMSDLRLYAVGDGGLEALAVPEGAADFLDLYGGLSLGTYSALRTFEHDKFLHLEWHIARTKLSMELMDIPL